MCVCVRARVCMSILNDSPRLYTGADSDRSGGPLGPKNARAAFLSQFSPDCIIKKLL